MKSFSVVAVGAWLGLVAAGLPAADDPIQLYTLESDARPRPVEGVVGVTESRQVQPHDLPALHERLQQMVRATNGRGAEERPEQVLLQLKLPLSRSVAATVEFRTASRGTGDRLLASGRVTAGHEGQLVLVVTPTTLDGRLRVDGEHFLIRSVGSYHFLLKLDPGALPPEAPPYLPKPLSGDPPHDHPAVNCNHEDAKVIRALVLYTQAARDGAVATAQAIFKQSGNTGPPPTDLDDSMETAIQLALQLANTALENSRALTSFDTSIESELVDPGYVEPGSGDTVLAALYNAGHPLRQAAAGRRAARHANLVALVVEDWNHCGGAPVMIDWNMHPDQAAYSVVRRACVGVEETSLGHELAHSMGSAHDHYNARVPGLFRYSYGHNQPAAQAGTMMAYECPGCLREPLFSNPDVNFTSSGSAPAHATGCPLTSTDPECPPAHNVDSLDRAACRVAQWR